MRWWREARFGLFIHWGLYAVPAGEYKDHRSRDVGEWIMSWANIPRAEYRQLAGRFNPASFDAREWVRIAKDAGMKYIVITSKHHDGFAMFDSKVSRYDIVDATPYRRDVMKALSEEAKRQGIRFGIYYSIMDWHHPSQFVSKAGKDPTAGDYDGQMKPDQKAAYLEYMNAQLAEVMTQYDPDILWFDGEWVNWWTEADGEAVYAELRRRKPSLLVNNRVGKGRQGMQGLTRGDRVHVGDFGTPEQQIPATGLPGVDWESCMTMNDTWGYKSYDINWKSPVTLVRNLIDTASKGGNYLLNVGPTGEGLIPPASVARLAAMGHWMKVNGEAIYGTSASPFAARLPWGRATSKGDRVYLFVYNWPIDGQLKLPAMAGRVTKARLLTLPSEPVGITAADDGITLKLPPMVPDPIATVIELTIGT